MPFAGLLRRPSTRVAVDAQTPVASSSYHASTSTTSHSHSRSSLSARERLSLGRSSKSPASLDTNGNGDLLYPTNQLRASHSTNRASHYSTTDDRSIGEAPSRSPASTQPAAPSASPLSSVPPSRSPQDTISSLYTTSQLNHYDRLFGLAGSSASVSPQRSPAPLSDPQSLPLPLPPSSSSTRSNPASSALLPTGYQREVDDAPLAAPSSAAALLRRRSTQPRSPYPPAAASTGASSSQRDRSTMGSTVFRKPSLRRRSSSQDSTASVTQNKVPQSPPPVPTVEKNAIPSSSVSSTAAPTTGAASNSAAANLVSSSSTGRFARLFGRRKSISSPNNARTLQKPDLRAEPVPVLKDASFSVNRRSPPLAVISAGSQGAAGDAKVVPVKDTLSVTPVSPRTVSHADSPPSAVHTLPTRSATRDAAVSSDKQTVSDVPARSKSVDGQTGRAASSFTFPARSSISNDSAQPTRSKNSKHAPSRSLPLTNLSLSPRITQSPSVDTTDSTPVAIQPPQRRRSRLSRSLSHRKNSKSLSMLGSIFGLDSQAPSASASPAVPQLTPSVSEVQDTAQKDASRALDATTSNHSRRPSLRSRLKMGRNLGEQGPQRPTTPEIESWKQRSADVERTVNTEPRLRDSVNGPSRLKQAEAPVKITRSKSMVRRKPAPEVKQEEIDSSSSTPVHGKTFKSLEVDRDAGSPLAGSLASSPATQPTVLAGAISDAESNSRLATHSSAPAASSSASAASSTQGKLSQIETNRPNGLGLIGALSAPSEHAELWVPSIDIRPSTPSKEASPVVATDEAASTQQNLALSLSPSVGGKRLSSGVYSVADTSLSVDRPWSLISTSEADTPLLKLRKLVVSTTGDDSREESGCSDGFFFRPVIKASSSLDGAETDEFVIVAPPVRSIENRKEANEMVDNDAEQLRSSSQMTTRSDTKHEIGSVHSSGSSTLRAARSVAAQPSVSGLSGASGALSDASQTSTVRIRNEPASLGQQAFEVTSVATTITDAADREADSVGPLPSRSPAASQLSVRSRQHRRNSSTGSAHSQTTIQQGRRASTASRITARSSGHWSESRVSEDALSALEAEVGQARRAEVVALGKGRVKDWVGGGGADRPLPTAEAPTLSRSNTLRHQIRSQAPSIKAAEGGGAKLDEREAQRQRDLNEHLCRRLQQLSDAQVESGASKVSTVADIEIRDIPDEESQDEGSRPWMLQDSAAIVAPRFARLSAFHDRKLAEGVSQPAPQTMMPAATSTSQLVEEAIRLGRAPSKRVRRDMSEAKSVGEAVMVTPRSANTLARRAGVTVAGSSLAATRQRRRSGSLASKKMPNSADVLNPTFVPALLTASLAKVQNEPGLSESQSELPPKAAAPSEPTGSGSGEADSRLRSKQRTFATSEEAARAKQLELVEREKRHAEKEARRQAQLQQKYAKKKQSDPLLAARLALAGLQPAEAVPKLNSGLRVASVPERHACSTSPSLLSVAVPPMNRKDSIAGSVTSFHTAQDVPIHEPVTTTSRKVDDAVGASRQQSEPVADVSSTSKESGEVRPDTSYSIASSLAVDFEFPVPPQRMKEQRSDDGTLLSRAGLQGSLYQQQWRGRRDYMSAMSWQRIRTPTRDSSLHQRTNSHSKRNTNLFSLFEPKTVSPASSAIPQLSPLDSFKQTVALRRSRSVGYNSRDVNKMTRDQLRQDASLHASPKSVQQVQQEWSNGQARGLGIDLDDSSIRPRYSNANANGTATPSTELGLQRQAIVA